MTRDAEAARIAEEWECVKRLLPLATDDINAAAETGQYEAGERIAAAIRAAIPKAENPEPVRITYPKTVIASGGRPDLDTE